MYTAINSIPGMSHPSRRVVCPMGTVRRPWFSSGGPARRGGEQKAAGTAWKSARKQDVWLETGLSGASWSLQTAD